jgi:hypothetical protein
LELPRIHNVFHVDLLLPYREMETYSTSFTRPPPVIDQGEEDNVYGPKLISDLQREEGWRQWRQKPSLGSNSKTGH